MVLNRSSARSIASQISTLMLIDFKKITVGYDNFGITNHDVCASWVVKVSNGGHVNLRVSWIGTGSVKNYFDIWQNPQFLDKKGQTVIAFSFLPLAQLRSVTSLGQHWAEFSEGVKFYIDYKYNSFLKTTFNTFFQGEERISGELSAPNLATGLAQPHRLGKL